MRLLVLAALSGALLKTHAFPLNRPATWKQRTEATLNSHTSFPPELLPKLIPRQSGDYETEGPGFGRFEWVNDFLQAGDRLARSSAPHYSCKDCDQRLTQASIDFLKQHKIEHVISLNSEAHDQSIKDSLKKNKIAYTPVPINDFHAPTLDDLKKGYDSFKEHRSGTLVWCGYGHGRTGTMVSALQIFSENDKTSGNVKKLSHYEYKTNHVETPDQISLLDKLQKQLHTQGTKPGGRNALGGVQSPGAAFDRSRERMPPGGAGRSGQTSTKPSRQGAKEFETSEVARNRPGANAPKVFSDMGPKQTSGQPPRQRVKEFEMTEAGSKKPNTKTPTPKVEAESALGSKPLKPSAQKLKVFEDPKVQGSSRTPGQGSSRRPSTGAGGLPGMGSSSSSKFPGQRGPGLDTTRSSGRRPSMMSPIGAIGRTAPSRFARVPRMAAT
ncbi:hypothetical protein CDD83_15 [Cordyceps sp. RAO-2017]|nr:hypothetical protein CDD83_15 [Cordyceps sp. RAO-2017]